MKNALRTTAIGAALALALVTTACTGGAGTSGTHTYSPGDLVLRVETTGGFIAPVARLSQYPAFSLFGDGTVISQGPVPAIYPGPALPTSLIETHLTQAGLNAVIDAATSAGLGGPDRSYTAGGVADVGTTYFRLLLDGTVHTVSVVGLGMQTPGIPSDQAKARQALSGLLGKLTDLSWLPKGTADGSGQYVFDRLAVLVSQFQPTPSGPTEPAVDWPLQTPLASLGSPLAGFSGTRCSTLSGVDLTTVVAAAGKATQISPWRSGGSLYSLILRPLLPDQKDCSALSG